VTKDDFRAAAAEAGFALCRFAAAGPAPHASALDHWLEDGCHGGMAWMDRTRAERGNPELLLPGVRTVIVLAVNYFHPDLPLPQDGGVRGRIARYAWGDDYHEIIGPRLAALCRLLSERGGSQRHFVDGGPVLERDWADACGVSWHGKSTMAINPSLGTWFFLATILTTLEFAPDEALPDRCGRCTRCIDACPTAAITEPYRLDARRCLSYLTIENKGPIPEEFRRPMGDRIFGCDDCLEACPWNRFAAASRDARLRPRTAMLQRPLREYLDLDSHGFKELFRDSPILRAKRRGFLRNVCVALGNVGEEDDLPALTRALQDSEELVREHAAWAVAEIHRRTGHQPRCSTESR
jgi:epoxyqueuosine reductase